MKTQMSSLEMHYLIRELQQLINSKVDKIYNPSRKEILIQLYVAGIGKKILRINSPEFFYLTTKKEEAEKPSGFCMFLRKMLGNSRIRSIRQLEFERIIEIEFETKQGTYSLIAEMFSKGNIILLTDNKIISAAENQEWSDRTINPKEKYKYPRKKYNFLKISEGELKQAVEESEKQSLVKTLALDIGLGGIYAEELCLISVIDKNKKKLDDSELRRLYDGIESMKSKKLEPSIFLKNNEVVDVTPFKLNHYSDCIQEIRDSYNEAMDSVFTKVVAKEVKEQKSKYDKQIEKFEKMVEEQQLKVDEFKSEEGGNQKKGELIYENYLLFSEVLKFLSESRKKHSAEELKKMLKNFDTVKEFDEKKGEITFEI